MERKIIILEDIERVAKHYQKMLIKVGNNVQIALNSTQFFNIYNTFKPQLILLDLTLKNSELDGLEVYRKLLSTGEFASKVIVLSSESPTGKVVEAIKLGAVTYHPKGADFDKDKFLLEIKQVFDQLEEMSGLKQNSLDNVFLGKHAKISELKSNIIKYAQTNMNILITGETGTGKSLLAKAVHQISKRSKNPFVDVDLKFFNENLIESELFGHVKGAFHGANYNKKGYIEDANNGTLFLDEIANLSFDNQAKLLKVIDEKRIAPVGGKFKDVNVRILAATNKELTKLVQDGEFREDLYHRFNQLIIDIPPLHERPSDIIYLIDFFLKENANEMNRKPEFKLSEISDSLIEYSWPGNVRPLKDLCRRVAEFNNVIDNKAILSEFELLKLRNKNLESNDEYKYPVQNNLFGIPDLYSATDNFEKIFIEFHLKQNSYKIGHTAKSIGIDRATLYKKMQKYGITKD